MLCVYEGCKQLGAPASRLRRYGDLAANPCNLPLDLRPPNHPSLCHFSSTTEDIGICKFGCSMQGVIGTSYAVNHKTDAVKISARDNRHPKSCLILSTDEVTPHSIVLALAQFNQKTPCLAHDCVVSFSGKQAKTNMIKHFRKEHSELLDKDI